MHRGWNSIEKDKGPYHPLLGYYGYKDKSEVLKHLKWLRRAGIDTIVYDIYGFAEWGPMDVEKNRVLNLGPVTIRAAARISTSLI